MDTIQALSIICPEKKSEAGLKSAYKKACLKHHPDRGGDVEIMKLVNVAYDYLKKSTSWWSGEQSRAAKQRTPLTDTMQAMIDRLKDLAGIKIEIIGSWLWVSGDTYSLKSVLKGLKMKFSGNKKAWYYHEDCWHKKSKKKFSMDDLRDLHGAHDVGTESSKTIAA